jgi:hypothetical protein
METYRVFDERPYFEGDSFPPAPADPYTLESVRAALGKGQLELGR